MIELVQLQIALSTAEEEQNYFTGPTSRAQIAPAPRQHATGTYRVVDGELYLIVPGAPPVSPPETVALAMSAPASPDEPLPPTGHR